jgi:hypothetical protein
MGGPGGMGKPGAGLGIKTPVAGSVKPPTAGTGGTTPPTV